MTGTSPSFPLAQELRAAGHEVIARNRVDRADDDPILSHVDPPPGHRSAIRREFAVGAREHRNGALQPRRSSATLRPGCSPRPAATHRMTDVANAYQPTSDRCMSRSLYEATDGREGGTLEGRPVVILTS